MNSQHTQESAKHPPHWASIQEAIKTPEISQLVPSYACFHNLLRKNRRRLIEHGAIIKAGRAWAVSISRAPEVIEQIYREQTLAALDRDA